MHHPLTSLTIVLIAAGTLAGAAHAEGKSHSVQGSPLDTIMSTRLWTDVAPVQEFVREARPDPNALEYQPLLGAEPSRPKPRDSANVQALKAELESDRSTNNRKLSGTKRMARAARAAKGTHASASAAAEPSR